MTKTDFKKLNILRVSHMHDLAKLLTKKEKGSSLSKIEEGKLTVSSSISNPQNKLAKVKHQRTIEDTSILNTQEVNKNILQPVSQERVRSSRNKRSRVKLQQYNQILNLQYDKVRLFKENYEKLYKKHTQHITRDALKILDNLK